jgi:geranylgeranyl diphosphate synthase, type I
MGSYFKNSPEEVKKQQGKNMAFNTTIVGLYLAPLILEKTEFNPEIKDRALNYFFRKSIETGWGEGLDVVAPFQSLEEKRETSQKIHDYKTVEYSGVMPLHLGALFAGKDDEKWLGKLDEYGRCVGRIFQIQDDIIGSFGDKDLSGKANDSDIKQAKWTVLLEILFASADESDISKVTNLLNKDKRSDEDVLEIREIMKKYQVVEKAQVRAKQYLEKGISIVPEITVNQGHQGNTEKHSLFYA